MATASKRITRKQLRQPDWFQIRSEQAIEYCKVHSSLVIAAGVAMVIFLLGVWAWQSFKDGQNVAAAQEFTKAVEAYQGGRHTEAIAGFDKVQTYRWSRYAGLAHIYQANSYLATNELDKAIGAAQRSISATGSDSLFRQIALITLASAEERKDQCALAIAHYSEAQRISAPLKEHAIVGKARCAERTGDKNLAIASYKEFLKENPNSPLAVKVAELEASIAAPRGSK